MVVVEGVSRSLNPHINMWEVARPVVEGYIRDNLGAKAVVRDPTETLLVLSRYGPLLPQMARRTLIERHDRPIVIERRRPPGWIYGLGGAALGAALVALGTLL
jgi:ubiquinone biosynthesis protein